MRPLGWWGELGGPAQRRTAAWLGVGWAFGNLAVFGLPLGIGSIVLGQPMRGIAAVALGAAEVPLTLAATRPSRSVLEGRRGWPTRRRGHPEHAMR